jgi:hypothetical protein
MTDKCGALLHAPGDTLNDRQVWRTLGPAPAKFFIGADKSQSGGRGQYLKTGSHQYMVRGASEKAGVASFVVAAPKKNNLQVFDKQLKQFHFREALDTSLEMGDPSVVSSLLEELACRNALDSALGESDFSQLLGFEVSLCGSVCQESHYLFHHLIAPPPISGGEGTQTISDGLQGQSCHFQ